MSESLKQVWGYSVLGDINPDDFSFTRRISWDELTELLERNPRVSMMCDWIAGEVIKNGWNWVQDEDITFINLEGVSETLPKDEYLELIHFNERIHRGIMFARLHGTSIMKITEEKGKLKNCKVYHRANAMSGWRILKEDIKDGKPFQFTLYMYPTVDEPAVKPEPTVSKLKIEDVIIFKNPMKGETWGGTPSSKLIAHVATLEELVIKLLAKHAIDLVDNFWHIMNIKSEEQAKAISTELNKVPLREFYSKDLEIVPMSLNIKGKTEEFSDMFLIMKNFMANGMRVSAQAMDGAPEGTISTAEFNTMIGYAVIEQMQIHWKPYIEDVLRKLGILYPDIIWNKPMVKLDSENQPEENGKEGKDTKKGKEGDNDNGKK